MKQRTPPNDRESRQKERERAKKCFGEKKWARKDTCQQQLYIVVCVVVCENNVSFFTDLKKSSKVARG